MKPATLVVRLGSNSPPSAPGAVSRWCMPCTPSAVVSVREAQIEGRELDLDAAFLLLVGEGLLDAVEAAFVGELVVLVVGVRRAR